MFKKVLRGLKVLAIIAIVILSFLLLRFTVFGWVMRVSQWYPESINVTDDGVTMDLFKLPTSTNYLNDYSYRIKDDILYIKARQNASGIIFKDSVNIKRDMSKINKIVREGSSEDVDLIWEREE